MSNKWIEKSELLIRTPQENMNEPPFIYFNKIAGFSFDHTLVRPTDTTPGSTYQSLTDWKLFCSSIIIKLETLHEDKYSIVAFSNIDITKTQSTREGVKYRFDKFCELLFNKNIPIVGIFAMKNEVCRKPHTGMWNILCELYKVQRFSKPNVETSLFVGNSAGRTATNKNSPFGKNPRDKNYVDRAFAWNLRLKFYTPEKFFLNKPIRKFIYPKNILTREEKIKIKEESEKIRVKNPFKKGVKKYLNKNFKGIKQFLLIITGPPSSTKTTLAKYIERRTKKYVNEGKLKTWIILNSKKPNKKFIKTFNDEITHGNSVILDGMNETCKNRSIYIEIVRTFENIGILIVELCVPIKIARHLNSMKIEMLKKFCLIKTNNIIFSQYNKNFQRPTNKEFENIHQSRFAIIEYPFLLIDVKEWWFVYEK